jgi:hypothetical protein
MEEETLSGTRFIIRYPNGIGGKDSPALSFPPACACCGAPAAGRSPLHIETHTGTARVWMDLQVPYCETCLGHVTPRTREGSSAKIMGTVLGFIVGLGLVGLFWAMGHNPLAHKGWDWYVFGAITAGVVTAAVVQGLLARAHVRGEGSRLPRTADCTLALHAKMIGGSAVWLETGSAAFAQAFREANPAFAPGDAIRIRATRTPRGDRAYQDSV